MAARHGGDLFVPVAFFVLAVLLFPFGIGPEPDVLARVAPGLIWVTALLSSMLSLDRLFAADHDDGSLDHLILSPTPLPVFVVAKVLAHWVVSGVPLVIVSPLLALILHLEVSTIGVLTVVMLLGTPILSLIGAVGASLALAPIGRGFDFAPCAAVLPAGIGLWRFSPEASQMGLSYQPLF